MSLFGELRRGCFGVIYVVREGFLEEAMFAALERLRRETACQVGVCE